MDRKKKQIRAHQVNKRTTLPLNGLRFTFVLDPHPKIRQRKKNKKSEKNEQKRKEKTPTHFSANVNGGLSFSFSNGRLILRKSIGLSFKAGLPLPTELLLDNPAPACADGCALRALKGERAALFKFVEFEV